MEAQTIQRVYIALTLSNTLATSLIWGINTLFLLDAGLSNAQAFLANAFFTAGQVLFEVPTGIVADSWGRRISYLLGAGTLAVTTILYYLAWQAHAPFIAWAATSLLLGLGFTFFSGATEAWLVDALGSAHFKGDLDSVFAKGQVAAGIAMLSGSIAGGVIAQVTSLGVPYLARAVVLGVNLAIAFLFMRDLGFTPARTGRILEGVKSVFSESIRHGLGKRPVRWAMLAAPFTFGVSFYAFYAMQPYLLQLHGDTQAYWVAGIAAAAVGAAQIAGGLVVPYVRKAFGRRTTILIAGTIVHVCLLAVIGITTSFLIATALLVLWALVFAAWMPVRQAYLNGLIPSQQRATVLSFDSLMGSSGGVVVQPALGKAADVWSYSVSFMGAAAFQMLALPFLLLARREDVPSDAIKD